MNHLTLDAAALEAMYQKVSLGSRRPDLMYIWCEHCQHSHYMTSKDNDICERLRREI